ncbi:type VII secretion protein EccE [Kitasatospora sp. NPDC052896]|uniref:type VII secretion protein EccE n=1 Tax=Kitasatospora sp. NPDC052896 TaxID=3364061 RepID=UPI0037C60A2C
MPLIARTPGQRVRRLVLSEVAVGAVAAVRVCAPRALVPTVVLAVLVLAGLLPEPERRPFGQLRALRRRRRVADRRGETADGTGAFAALLECEPALRTLTHQGRDGRAVGLVGDGTFLTAVLAVRPAGSPLRTAREQPSLDLALLHGALRTAEVRLESVQLLQYVQPGPAPRLASEQPGLAPPAVRLSWLCLKLAPELCPEAVLARGGGQLGARRCVVLAADQLARAVRQSGFEAVLLDEAGLLAALGTALCVHTHSGLCVGTRTEPCADTHTELCACRRGEPCACTHTQPRACTCIKPHACTHTESCACTHTADRHQRSTETATHWQCGNRWHSVFWLGRWPELAPGALPELTRRLTALPALATVLSITVGDGPYGTAELTGNLRLVTQSSDELDLLSDELSTAATNSGALLVRLDREQLPGVLATLPLGGTR